MRRINAMKYENETYWIGTDLGMNEVVSPSMYYSYRGITLLEKRNTKEVTVND